LLEDTAVEQMAFASVPRYDTASAAARFSSSGRRFRRGFSRLERILPQRFDLMRRQASRRVAWVRPSQAYDEQRKFARFYSSPTTTSGGIAA